MRGAPPGSTGMPGRRWGASPTLFPSSRTSLRSAWTAGAYGWSRARAWCRTASTASSVSMRHRQAGGSDHSRLGRVWSPARNRHRPGHVGSTCHDDATPAAGLLRRGRTQDARGCPCTPAGRVRGQPRCRPGPAHLRAALDRAGQRPETAPARHSPCGTTGPQLGRLPASARFDRSNNAGHSDRPEVQQRPPVGPAARMARIGVTDFAQQSLGDVVDVTLPRPGDMVTAGEACGDIESTKSVSDLIAPVTGTVRARNEDLTGAPDLVNTDPYGQGWMLEIETDPATLTRQLAELMDARAYREVTGA